MTVSILEKGYIHVASSKSLQLWVPFWADTWHLSYYTIAM